MFEADLLANESKLSQADKEKRILAATKSKNTIDAMKYAVDHFSNTFGGKLPTNEEELKNYLVYCSDKYSAATLSQRLSLLGSWHRVNGFQDPSKGQLIKDIMSGIKRLYGTGSKQANAVSIEDLDRIVNYLDRQIAENNQEDIDYVQKKIVLSALRNKAIILTSFWFGLRSDNLVRIRFCDLTFHNEAETPFFELFLLYTKTRKGGEKIKLERMTRLCPMRALQEWVDARNMGVHRAGDEESRNPVFVKVTRWGKLNETAMGRNAINKIYIDLFKSAKITTHYSTHSMRRGLANWLASSGANVKELMGWVGWKDERSAIRYLDAHTSLPNKLLREQDDYNRRLTSSKDV